MGSGAVRRPPHLSLAALNGASGLVQATGQAVVGQRLLHHHLPTVERWQGGVSQPLDLHAHAV